MGQYHIIVNLDKREFIEPHPFGCGLKLWEQLAAMPGTGQGLLVLLTCSNGRGGGDLGLGEPASDYAAVAKRTIGRWKGDRIAIVGDYAELGDIQDCDEADIIYHLCGSQEDRQSQADYWLKADFVTEDKARYQDKAMRLLSAELYTDISLDVAAVIEHELDGKFVGDMGR